MMDVLQLFLLISLAYATKSERENSFRDKTYVMSDRDMMITENRSYCTSRGMTLAFIRNKDENNFLRHFVADFMRIGAVWNRTKRAFEWDDGSPMTYTNWAGRSTCPEGLYNDITYSGTDEFCSCTVEMDSVGGWNIFGCRSEAEGLCQKVRGSTESVPTTFASLSSSPSSVTIVYSNTESIETTTPTVSREVEDSAFKTTNLTSIISILVSSHIQNRTKQLDERLSILSKKVEELSEKFDNRTRQVKDHLNSQLKQVNEYLQQVHEKTSVVNEHINRTNKGIESIKDVFGQRLLSDHDKTRAEIESIQESIRGMNNALNEIRNRSNYLTLDESKIMRMVYKLDEEKEDMALKVVGNENSVNDLSRKYVLVSVLMAVIIAVLIIYTSCRNYNGKSQFSYKKQSPEVEL